MLDALTYLHNHEPPIIHRDIKPQNLKLTDENNIILLDFGLSKNSIGETKVSTTGSIVGYTPHYAPMEQIRGTGTDPRSDIYALSATLYQILTNVVPSDALTRADALISGFEEPIAPLSSVNPEVPKPISDIILTGMSVSQDKRFKTARDMQKALRNAYTESQTGSFNQPSPSKLHVRSEIQESHFANDVSQIPSGAGVTESLSQPASQSDGSISKNEKFNSQPAPAPAEKELPKQDFDATIPLNMTSDEGDMKQADIKTEVLIAGSYPEITAAQNGKYGNPNEGSKFPGEVSRENDFGASDFDEKPIFPDNNEDFSLTNDFSLKNDFNEHEENFSPDATVPLFTSDKLDASEVESDFDVDSFTDSKNADDFASASNNYSSAPNDYKTPTPIQKSAASQKSNGKMYAIVGGLGALLILAIGAVALFVLLSGGDSTVQEDLSTPTPMPTIEITPTPAPTMEAVINTNSETNTAVNADNSETVSSDTSESTANKSENTSQSGKSPKVPINQPNAPKTPTPRIVQQGKVDKPAPPIKTPEPKKTPVRGSRTDILP